MRVSLSWLQDYVTIDMETSRLAEALTMSGLEVEALVDRYAYLDRIVVGRIIEMASHPNADALSVCKIDVGNGTKTIVCAAANIQKGNLVPVALAGAELASGDRIAIERVRGQASEGMLCSEAELGVGTDRSGILLLPETAAPGAGIAAALGLSDTIIEFDLTPNRPDCLSVIGIAREVAAIVKKPLRFPEVTLPAGETPVEELTSVTIEAPDHCARYAARMVLDVNIGPSPFWLQDRLHSIGFRSINNVVDATNFVMMEMGQPLHAFDFHRLGENRIVVKTAQGGQDFVTLDGVQRGLGPDMLMICDGKGPVALAGIMGGLDSEIKDDTRAVLIESAYFDPISIRRTAKRLGLNTESSFRFERGVDPEGIPRALDRAAQLIVQTAGGRLAAGVIDNYPRPIPQRTVELSVKRTNRLLGLVMTQDEMTSYLRSVQLEASPADEDRLTVVAPTFRVDLKRPEDLMEEVARLKGYDQIPTTDPLSHVVANPQDKKLQLRNQLRQVFAGCGFSEVVTYSFIAQEACGSLHLAHDDPRRRMVSILNPLTEDQGVMRTSLLPGLLAAMHRNSTQQNMNLRLYEIGKIFLSPPAAETDELPEEVHMISGLWTGARHDRTWHGKEEQVDFYDVKGVVESVCAALRVQALRFTPPNRSDSPYLQQGHAAKVYAGDECLGELGELTPEVLKNFELKHPAFCFDLNFDRLILALKEEKHVRPVSRFPATIRDVALILDNPIEAQGVLDFINALGQALIGGVEIFDVYEGPPVPQGKKSMALRLTYQSFERSLTDTEVNRIHESVTKKVLKQFNGQLPSSGGRLTVTR